MRRLRQLAVVDTTPLRQSPGFRWLFVGFLFVQGARQLTVVAVPFQVFEITGSTLAVGMLGLAQLIPLLILSIVGGALADAIDRRKILIIAPLVLALTAGGLTWNALLDKPLLWPLFVLSAINAGVSALDGPARQAMVPGLVNRSILPSALALNQILINVAKAVFPALAGVLIATVGLSASFGVETAMFLIGGLFIRGIPRVGVTGGGRRVELSSIIEGFRYLKNMRIIQAALLLDLSAMVFAMPTALFPAIGTETFGGDAVTVGLLYAAPGVGSLLGALTSGWVASVRRQGRAVVFAVAGWGCAIAVFGLTRSLPLALLMLAIGGIADVVSTIFRGTIIQLNTPNELRGRVSSMHIAVATGGPRLGDVEAGTLSAFTSVPFAVVAGGLLCALCAAGIARWAPTFVRYEPDLGETTRSEEPAR
jgi:MFS family permease